jgi:hypothetical protein
MAKQKAGVDRGRMQSDAAGQPGKVMRAGFQAGSDHGPNVKRVRAFRSGNRNPKNVNSYPRQFQSSIQQIDAALSRGAKK